MSKADIGMIGLAVMGENLALNMESKGYIVAVFNIHLEMIEKFLNNRGKGKDFIGAFSYEEFVDSLKKPRKIMLMIKAGEPVDHVIENLIPLLDKEDIIIDGGNSNYFDTMRRTAYVEEKGLYYIGTGVSGGEEGALKGPSIMPGGSPRAWPHVKDIFQNICAKVQDGTPCCQWVGDNGAGHFVKMVHNGIEYGDMQLICEAYSLLKNLLGLDYAQMHEIFKNWNSEELDSYLIEITADILNFKDEDGEILVGKILDTAEQKGTGKWTVNSALEQAVPLTLISEAVFARVLSSQKEERVKASKQIKGITTQFTGNKEEMIVDIKNALYASKIVSYAQGYALLKSAAKEYSWKLNYGEIALMWRGGCIIRSAFLGKIKEAYQREPDLENLMMDSFFRDILEKSQMSWRKVCSSAMLSGISAPAFASALNYFDGYRTETLPANLLQAQRDYFGAHTYERTDKPRGEFFHTNWSGRGGDTASTRYNA